MPTPAARPPRPVPSAFAIALAALVAASAPACDGGSDGHPVEPGCPDGRVEGPGGACVEPGPGCADGLDGNGDGWCDRLAVDWSRDAVLPEGGDRRDLYGLGPGLPDAVRAGLRHALVWPVEVTGILLPWRPLAQLLDPAATDSSALAAQDLVRNVLGFGTTDEMLDWLGLVRADGRAEALPGVPWPEGVAAGDPLGMGLLDTADGQGLTFSCATCHTAQLFGRTVVGLTNRRAKANEFFHLAKQFFPALSPDFFQQATDADEGEMRMFVRAQANLSAIGSKEPEALGLDTSLAQVSLSLARRGPDPYAERDAALEQSPPANLLDTFVADSKPAVWWTLRYKTRWLSDGSIVSGNPIYTNFLWNELGRGVDLHDLERWLKDNQRIVDELTVAAFASEPPRWSDFFGADGLDLAAAKRGKALFDGTCATCHGTYEKAWEGEEGDGLDVVEATRTTRVVYHRQTPVLDVGTDPQRAQGMAAFADRLNGLAISQTMGTVVEVQQGYVPPPLVGIWARYPYLHNQSVPTLCDLLTPGPQRPREFWMGPDEDPETDFDADCVGLPVGDAVPEAWKADAHARYDTSGPGLSNRGHDAWLTDAQGNPTFDAAARADLVAFLKTL